jgi:hypothetical protein
MQEFAVLAEGWLRQVQQALGERISYILRACALD